MFSSSLRHALDDRLVKLNGLGIGATAVTLHAYSVSGVVPKASINLGPLHGSVMTTTSSVSTGQLVLVALIWAVIAVINIAYARRQPRRP